MKIQAVMAYTIPQVAQMFNISRTTIYRRVIDGDLPSIKLGKSRRILAVDLNAWIARESGSK